MTDLVELYRGWDAGESVNAMSNRLGLDRKTIRKYVGVAVDAGLAPGVGGGVQEWMARIGEWFPDRADARLRRSSWSVFDEHEAWIRAQLDAAVTMATIWQRLRDDYHVEGSERSLNRWVAATIDPVERAGVKATALMPASPPGEVGQVDYGLMGTWEPPEGGKRVRVQGWIMTLPCSRNMFVYPTMRMRQPDWEAAHVACFEFFGGTPRRIVCDNLKTGVLKPDLYDPAINKSYQQLASHYGCLVDPARVARPKDYPDDLVIPRMRSFLGRVRTRLGITRVGLFEAGESQDHVVFFPGVGFRLTGRAGLVEGVTQHVRVGASVDVGGGDVGVAEEFFDVGQWHSGTE